MQLNSYTLGVSISGLDFVSSPSWELKKYQLPFTKTVKLCSTFNFLEYVEMGYACSIARSLTKLPLMICLKKVVLREGFILRRRLCAVVTCRCSTTMPAMHCHAVTSQRPLHHAVTARPATFRDQDAPNCELQKFHTIVIIYKILPLF